MKRLMVLVLWVLAASAARADMDRAMAFRLGATVMRIEALRSLMQSS